MVMNINKRNSYRYLSVCPLDALVKQLFASTGDSLQGEFPPGSQDIVDGRGMLLVVHSHGGTIQLKIIGAAVFLVARLDVRDEPDNLKGKREEEFFLINLMYTRLSKV